MHLRLLGPIRLMDGDRDVPLGRVQQRATLAVLALSAPRTTTTDGLIDALWGDEPPDSARNAVQVYISGLRKALASGSASGTATVERIGDGYRLSGSHVVIDAATFQERLTEGRAALRADDLERAVGLLDAALEQWDGPPLQGCERLPFHAASALRLEDARVQALTERADSLLRLRRCDEAARSAAEAVTLRPYDEHAWGLLATAEYHAGRQNDALATMRRVREVLAEELGLDPTKALVDLESHILRQQLAPPWPSAGPVDAPRPALPELPQPFVGRVALVDEVVRLLTTERLVTLAGLGGIGKTTTATAVARLADEGRAVHFVAVAAERTSAGAVERLCRAVGIETGDDPVAALAGIGIGSVVVLDNVEQIDGIGPAVARILTETPLSLLVTTRRALRVRDERVVSVGPLEIADEAGHAAAVELFLARANQIRALDAPSAAAAADICRAVDGIPLAIELMAGRTRVLTVQQLADRIAQRRLSPIAAGRRSDLAAGRAGMSEILDATLELLPSSTVELLSRLGSGAGWMTLDLVESFASPDGSDLVDEVEDLVEAGLAEFDDGRIRLRETVREHARRRGDRSAADGAFVDAVAALVSGAAAQLIGPDSAEAVASLAADHDSLGAAVDVAVDLGLARPAAVLALGLNRFWVLTGRIAEGGRYIRAVRGLTGHGDQDSARLDVLAGTFGSYVNDPDAVPLLEQALPRAEKAAAPVDRLLVNGWCCLAAVLAHRGDHGAARRAADRATAMAAAADRPELVALARDLSGHIAAYRNDHAEALRLALEGIADARRGGDRHDLINLLGNAGDSALQLGRVDDALTLTWEAFALAAEIPAGPNLGGVLLSRAAALTAAGRLPEARGCLTQALRVNRASYADPMATADAVAILAAAASIEGSDEFAARLLGAAEGLYADAGAEFNRLAPILTGELDRLRDRHEPNRLAVLLAAGAGDPQLVINMLLREPDAGAGTVVRS